MKSALLGLVVGLLLMLGGSFFASHVQTSDGVTVEDVRIPLQDGSELSAYLYTPETRLQPTLRPAFWQCMAISTPVKRRARSLSSLRGAGS